MNLVFELWSIEIEPEVYTGNIDFYCDRDLYSNIVESIQEAGITVRSETFHDEKDGYARIYLDKDSSNIEKLKEIIKILGGYGGSIFMKYENGLGTWWDEINDTVEHVCESLDVNVGWFMDNKVDIAYAYAKLVKNICHELGVRCELSGDLDPCNMRDYNVINLKIGNGKILID